MSFELHVQPCRFDGTTDKRVNPVTKQLQDIPRNQPLSELEVSAVRKILEGVGAKVPDGRGCYVARLPDGAKVEVEGVALHLGCTFSVEGTVVTVALAQLLFDVIVAGNWVILGEDCIIAPNAECVWGAPDAFGRVCVATSARKVSALLNS